jgi:hypothetical protein
MIPQLPNQVIIEMAKRHHRIHHFLWHEVRNNWLDYDEATKNELKNEGWEPPRPALSKSDPVTGQRPIFDNFSGEDFLFMHREMIKLVNQILNEVSDPQYPKIEGWKTIPRPDDLDYPVPPTWDGADEFFETAKSDDFFNQLFLQWESAYTDSNFLSGITLGELGSRLEFSIHNVMHVRWASRPIPRERPLIDATSADTIDTVFDDPSYNFLADTYSSHVNPIFWKLHGWIDDRIEDWKNANGVTGDIQWTGTWMGHMHGHINANLLLRGLSRSREDTLENMSKVLKIISGKVKPNPFQVVDPSLF